MLDKVLRIAELYDFYGALLTDKQRRCLEMHYLSDDSLAEIAEEFGVSRQAVHDIRHRRERDTVAAVRACLESLPDGCRSLPAAREAAALLDKLTES